MAKQTSPNPPTGATPPPTPDIPDVIVRDLTDDEIRSLAAERGISLTPVDVDPEENARPPRHLRDTRAHPFEKLAREDLAFFPVSETVNQLNAGVSISQELLAKGWIKPQDPELLCASPNGLSFNMIMPKVMLEKQRKKNDDVARAMEGFRDHEMVKEQTKEETVYKGQELLEAAGLTEREEEVDG